MVSAITATASTHPPNPKKQHQTNPRSPLLPSEKDNGGGGGTLSRRPKPKPKEPISSRYMSSSSTPRRYPYPSPPSSSRSSGTATPLRRSQSVERVAPTPSRPTTPKPNNAHSSQMSAASKLLLSSTRSLSVSFQGESYSLPISKIKPPPPNVKRAVTPTPEWRKAVTPTPTPIEQHRWHAARSRQTNNNALTRSMVDLDRRASLDARLNPKFGKSEISKIVQVAIVGDDVMMSDTESVSSGSNSNTAERNLHDLV